eukprot:1292130-Pleurochrysis_carterae.AAC.1
MCKSLPFATVDEYTAAKELLESMKADVSKEGKMKFAAAKSAHSSTHCSQPLFERPSLHVGMKNVVPDLLHVGNLYVDKQASTPEQFPAPMTEFMLLCYTPDLP